MKLLMAALAAALSLALSGCIFEPGKPDVSVRLPRAPAYYEACFKQLTPEPVGTLTREKVVRLIAELRQSEKRKSQCGRDLLNWYDTVVTAYGKKA